MASWLPSSIQKRLLRFALSRSGLLDDAAIDLDKLDITLGRQNVVELKDVGLNLSRISKLAQLPPSLRLETARVLSLRVTIPADIFQSSLIFDVDGVEVRASYHEDQDVAEKKEQEVTHGSASAQSPSHRKTARRIRSPLPRRQHFQEGSDDEEESRLPTAQDLARSFLLEEPALERQELEASVAANAKSLDESIVSESSDAAELGTGAALGIPAFLADFLQGIVNRVEVRLKNISLTLSGVISSETSTPIPLSLRLCVGTGSLERLQPHDSINAQTPSSLARKVQLHTITLDLMSSHEAFTGLTHISPTISTLSRKFTSRTNTDSEGERASLPRTSPSLPTSPTYQQKPASSSPEPAMVGSILASAHTLDADRFADAFEDDSTSFRDDQSELDIRPGDDNISWGSRRSRAGAGSDELWNSTAGEDDLPDSLLLDSRRANRPDSNSAHASPNSTGSALPYNRPGFQSPGSWPAATEYFPTHHTGVGAWPAPYQSQQSLPTSSDSELGPDADVLRDNRRTALEAPSHHHQETSDPLAQDDDSSDAGLEQSRIYTHQEAESMYMSALAHECPTGMPGAWSSEVRESVLPHQTIHDSALEAGRQDPFHEADNEPEKTVLDENVEEDSHSDVATPRAQSPFSEASHRTRQPYEQPSSAKQLLLIDMITVFVPDHTSTSDAENVLHEGKVELKQAGGGLSTLPGTFSTYSEASALHRSRASGTESVSWDAKTFPNPREVDNVMKIQVASIDIKFDVSTVQILGGLVSVLKAMVPRKDGPQALNKDQQQNAPQIGSWDLSVQAIDLAFHEQLRLSSAGDSTPKVPAVVALRAEQLAALYTSDEKRLTVGNFTVFVGEVALLTFDREGTIPPHGSAQLAAGLEMICSTSRVDYRKRAIPEVDIRGLRLKIDLDIHAIDRAFGFFGGLGGVLELGSSMLSDSVPLDRPKPSKKPVAGVHFEGDVNMPSTSPGMKLNARLEGVSAYLRGQTCSIALQTTAMKAIYREQNISATTTQISINGPHLSNGGDVSSVVVNSIRLDYLTTPQDKDLEKFLALLTPSKDKYDNDDDILIETLLRQRKKGACLRVTFDDVRARVSDWDGMMHLDALSKELAQLAAVTKYLPEDDRPSLLVMFRVKDVEARMPLNDSFGSLQILCREFSCAHVGLPALVALSLSDLLVRQVDGVELVHAFLPLAGADNLPMIMARMLGDEVEPTVKIKVFNVCAEYSVATLIGLMDETKDVTTEQLVSDLSKSIADLTFGPDHEETTELKEPSSPSPVAKKTNIKVLIRSCAIGLSPERLPSKAYVVLTEANLALLVPPADTMKVSVGLRRAAIFVTDDASHAEDDGPVVPGRALVNTATDARISIALARRGYASMASIMSAHVDIKIHDPAGGLDKTIEVDLRNELLLLETCADSTQTLIATLNALTPPSPPNKQAKYLTEPMTLEDMISSFTGEEVVKPEERPETIFDVDEAQEFDSVASIVRSPIKDSADDLLAESEMTSSLYGPVSGIIGDLDDDESVEESTRDFAETAESLLEEDPFVMPDSTADMPFSDSALLKDLRQQAQRPVHDESVELEDLEIEDLGFDALGPEMNALGTHYRFNTPLSRQRKGPDDTRGTRFPFRLRLRDVHVIWNIYDGYDWQKTRDGITAAVEKVEMRAEERLAKRRQSRNDVDDEESVIGDILFNSIYIGVPSTQEAQDIRRQINRHIDDLASETESVPLSGVTRPTSYSVAGKATRQQSRRRLKLERSKSHKVAFELKGVSVDLLVYPPDNATIQSSVDLRVRSFEIYDNVPTSTWRKFLTKLHDDQRSTELSKPMFHIELLNVKTIQDYAATEIVLHVSVSPLRLHVDQDALDFITRFFEFKDDTTTTAETPADQPFLQRVEVETVDLQLDYKPKKVDYVGLRSGHTNEFMNFVILDAAKIRLKHAIVYGIRGFEPLHKTLNDVWMPDVKRNQLPTVLAGLAPVRSLVNIGTGVRDVVAIPIREYKKDGRVMRSIQKGAFHFGKTTASELARLGAKVAIGTQNILQGAEGLLAPGTASPSGRPGSRQRLSADLGWYDPDADEEEKEQRAISAYADQPLGVLAGLRSARRYLEHDLLTARDAFIAVQGEVLESDNPGAAAAAVVKYTPTVILRPVIGASRAVGATLLGVGNQIDRENIRRMEDKYKRH